MHSCSVQRYSESLDIQPILYMPRNRYQLELPCLLQLHLVQVYSVGLTSAEYCEYY